MATFAIGDLHGNRHALERLLDEMAFDPHHDRLWFVGDLVNRGPDSLDCLRFIRGLGNTAVTVLGNHDLALLVQARKPNAKERLAPELLPLLQASDGEELLAWLRHRPLLHTDADLGWTMVHAGIPASWDLPQAHRRAAELENALRGSDHDAVLAGLYGDTPAHWSSALTGMERLRYITNALTRQRFIHADGSLDMRHKAGPDAAPADLMPWFLSPGRRSMGCRIVFGHWSTLAPKVWPSCNVWCIDSGAAWGGALTALRLDATMPRMLSVPG